MTFKGTVTGIGECYTVYANDLEILEETLEFFVTRMKMKRSDSEVDEFIWYRNGSSTVRQFHSYGRY